MIPRLNKQYGMIPRLTFACFLPLSSTCYVVPIVRYNAEKGSNLNMHNESKNQDTKARMETKKQYFLFLNKAILEG